MASTFPGTTIETTSLEKGSSRRLFEGIFATGGITLSQVSIMTGLEPYVIQNWVKRGFLSPPVKRTYSKNQLARIVIINMLRDTLQLEKICSLIQIIGGDSATAADDLIGDDELYHRYVDMLSDPCIRITKPQTVQQAAQTAVEELTLLPHAKQQLIRILQIMLYAHSASQLRQSAEEMFAALQ
ncbi:MAG: DUF1836 domain-containing protein [Clostridia bacterium]|nr:DUF1836 domain-containing protein [Clostridia bacterium]